MLKSIEEEWLGFAEMVIPSMSPHGTQYKEMKKAFFAGAWALHQAVVEIGDVSEEEGCEFLTKISTEISEFKAQMMREYGERN